LNVARRLDQSLRSHFTPGLAFGTRFLLKALLILVLALVSCGALVALTNRLATAAPNTIKAANWSGGAVFRGPGKQFDRCSAASANANGMAITYAMDRQLRWSLAISNAEWSFTNDFSLSINLDLDGRPFRGLQQRIEVLRSHHLKKLDDLRRECRIEPRAAATLLPTMYGRPLRGFHRFLAVSETVAHLHYLWHAGDLNRHVEADGRVLFSAA